MDPREFQDIRSGRTVSTEKWVIHARQKLAKGYVLVVNPERKTATFFMPGRGYEACNFKAAQALIKAGEVVEAGRRASGLKYELADIPVAPPKPVKRIVIDDDDDDLDGGDDLSDILDTLEDAEAVADDEDDEEEVDPYAEEAEEPYEDDDEED